MADVIVPNLARDAVPRPPGPHCIGLRPFVIFGISVIAIFFGGLIGWSALAPLDSAAVAPGVVSLDTNRKTIQHLEGGIISEILVGEGDEVKVGRVLLRLDQLQASAILERLRGTHEGLSANAARLAAERDGLEVLAFPEWMERRRDEARVAKLLDTQTNVFEAGQRRYDGYVSIYEQQIAQQQEEIKGFKGQIAAEDTQLRLIREELTDMRQLYAKRLIPKSRLLALERHEAELAGNRSHHQAAIARAEQSIGEKKIRIAELDTARANEAVEKLQDVQGRILELEERTRAAEDVLKRTEIRAPVSGSVLGLNVHTAGGVISPGEPLMDIVPTDERLIIEVEIDPSDIEAVVPGQATQVRLTAFQQRNLAPLEGRLISVSADRMIDEREDRAFYLGRIELLVDPSTALEGSIIQPGMQAEVIILTGRSTVFDYIMRPVSQTFERAFREK